MPEARKGPRKVTPASLENAALHYLARFATTAAHLRGVLMRRVERSARHHGTDSAEGEKLVDALIERYARSGLLDDAAYAGARAATLRRSGASARGIRAKLMQKGLDPEQIDAAVRAADEDTENGEIAAALALARRRRIGPFRPAGGRAEAREKDLAALARAGFSYDVARRVVEGDGEIDA